MSTYNYAALARSMYEGFNSRDLDKAVSVVSDDYELHYMPTGQTFRGPEGFRPAMNNWATAFPDGKVEIKNVVAAGDQVVVEYVFRGTHAGPLTSPMGTIPPTGRPMEMHVCDVYWCKDGKIVRGHSYFDVATMMRQLGLMPEQPGVQPLGLAEQPGATPTQ